jgi:hypothetical protein
MRSLHAGSASMHARRRANIEPALAPPGGESLSSRSAHVNRRCTFIKRALVRTVGGAKHARRVCVSLPETRGRRPPRNVEGRMGLISVLEDTRSGMRDSVNAGARQPLWLEQVHRFLQLAAAVFEGGGGSADLRDEALEHLGDRFARPAIGHRDGDAVDVG